MSSEEVFNMGEDDSDANAKLLRQQEQKRAERAAQLPLSVQTGIQPNQRANVKLPDAKSVDILTALGRPSSMQLDLVKIGERTIMAESVEETMRHEGKEILVYPYPLTNSKVPNWLSRIPTCYIASALAKEKDDEDPDEEKALSIFNKLMDRGTEDSPLITIDQFRYSMSMSLAVGAEEELERDDYEEELVALELGDAFEALEDDDAREKARKRLKREVDFRNYNIDKANKKAKEESAIYAITRLIHTATNRKGQVLEIEEIEEMLDIPFLVNFLYHSLKVNRNLKKSF